MKTKSILVLWAFICLFPAFLAGQAIQNNSPLLVNDASLRALQLNSMQSMTESPLLRISNIGSSGQDGVSIELNSLSLTSPGPTVRFNCPDPLISGSGNFRIQPSIGNPSILFDNIGSSGQDGVRMTILDPPDHSNFFDVHYDLEIATEMHRLGTQGDPDFDLRLIRTYDKATPKLLERIASASVDSFFDVFYDLDLGFFGTGFGNNPDNLCAVIMFDPATPGITERLSSNNAGVQSFFDVFVDLDLGTETRRLWDPGDPDFDLLSVRTYDKATPKLLERIASASVDSFFDISYDLELGIKSTGFGQNPNNICAVRTFDPATPSLLERISSNLPTVESFFDVFVDLDLGTETRRLGTPGLPLSDLVVTRKYDKATPKLQESITSGSALTFFDITYELDLGRETRRFAGPESDPDFDLLVIHDYDRGTPKLSERILSSDPLLVESFFDISHELNLDEGLHKTKFHDLELLVVYHNEPTARLTRSISSIDAGNNLNWFFEHDLSQGTQKTVYQDLQLLETFDELAPTLVRRLESTNPAFAGRFIEERLVIDTEMIPLSLTSVGFPGTVDPLEVRYEYDGLSRSVREITTDTDNGVTLLLDRRLTPTGPTLVVGGHLAVEGGTITSSPLGAPILIAGIVQMNGGLTVTGPSNQVNGDLHVQGTFTSSAKMFKIDHPLDPDNKYLIHSCIESPDMMNIYNGNVVTDASGYATIILPEYFEALNNDFRYQLTCMGQFAQAIVDQKIKANRFVIRTDKPNVEVSWQVTGIRHDPGSKRESYAIEIDKEPEMKGKRLYQQ